MANVSLYIGYIVCDVYERVTFIFQVFCCFFLLSVFPPHTLPVCRRENDVFLRFMQFHGAFTFSHTPCVSTTVLYMLDSAQIVCTLTFMLAINNIRGAKAKKKGCVVYA